MHELSITTTRIRRGPLGWLKRRPTLYETKVSDGKRVACGRGSTLEASVDLAQRIWDAQFEICPLAHKSKAPLTSLPPKRASLVNWLVGGFAA